MQTNLERIAILKHRAQNALQPHTRLSGCMDCLFSDAESDARSLDSFFELLEQNVREMERVELKVVEHG